MADKSPFGLDIEELLNSGSGMDKDDAGEKKKRERVKSEFTSLLEKAETAAKGAEPEIKIDDTHAKQLLDLVAGKATQAGWTGKTLTLAEMSGTTPPLIDSTLITAPDPVGIDKAGELMVLSSAMAEKNKWRDHSTNDRITAAPPAGLGYTDFVDDVNTAYTKVVDGKELKEQVQETINFTKSLKTYVTDAKKWQTAFKAATQAKRDAIGTAADGVVDTLKEAIEARAKWREAADDASKIPSGTTLNDLAEAANRKEKALRGAFDNAVEEAKGTDGKVNEDLLGAIKQIVHQKVQAGKSRYSTEWAKLGDDDKAKEPYVIGAGGKDGNLAGYIDKNIAELHTIKGEGQGLSGPSAVGAGASGKKDRGDSKGSGNLGLGLLAAGGLAVAAAGAMSGKSNGGVDEQGNPIPEKKKWGFGRIAAVTAGAVMTVAAIVAMSKGKGDSFGEKLKSVTPGMGGRG